MVALQAEVSRNPFCLRRKEMILSVLKVGVLQTPWKRRKADSFFLEI